MNNNIGKCGCDCPHCPTYKDNIKTIKERIKCSAGWSKYLNIKLSPEKLRTCDGCSLPDSDRKIYYLNCSVRKCCMENDIRNCAYCTLYPCDELKHVHSIVNIQTKEELTDNTGKSITNDDYMIFVEPYAGIKHLNEIRNNIQKSEIKDYKKYSVKIKFAGFPQRINNNNEINSFNRIYSFLTSIGVLPGGLRNEGWKIIISFGSDVADLNALGTLKKYVTGLNDKYQKKAYTYFNKADLNPVIA